MAPEAEKLARGALARFVASKFPHDETFARAVLVRALVRSGKLEAAATEREALEASLPKCQLFEARFEAWLAAIDEAVARNEAAKALELAHAARAEAERAAFVPLVLEARLSETTLARGAERQALAAKLDHDAKTAGFVRVAQLARK